MVKYSSRLAVALLRPNYGIMLQLRRQHYSWACSNDSSDPYSSWARGMTAPCKQSFRCKLNVQYKFECASTTPCIDEFQINEINVDLRTSGFDNEVLSVDACAVWWERESFYCLPRIGVVTWHREPRFQCGSAPIWNSSIDCFGFLCFLTITNVLFRFY